MALIKVELSTPPVDGMDIKFKAPCNCTEITGLLVEYPEGNQEFTFRDCHSNNLAGIGNLFGAGAYVKVILDVENGYAYIQNSDTNAYLESRLKGKELWAGSWEKGSIDVPGISQYVACQILIEGQGTTILAMRNGSHLRGIGGYTSATPTITTYHFAATVSGETITLVEVNSFGHVPSGQHGAVGKLVVSKIIGLFVTGGAENGIYQN